MLSVELFIYYILAINILTFVMYGMDKLRAKRGWWRTPESTLLLLAFIGGSIGAWLGMIVWRHKTRHWKFRIGVPLILIIHISLILLILHL